MTLYHIERVTLIWGISQSPMKESIVSKFFNLLWNINTNVVLYNVITPDTLPLS
jgi:hypothetical protein